MQRDRDREKHININRKLAMKKGFVDLANRSKNAELRHKLMWKFWRQKGSFFKFWGIWRSRDVSNDMSCSLTIFFCNSNIARQIKFPQACEASTTLSNVTKPVKCYNVIDHQSALIFVTNFTTNPDSCLYTNPKI